MRTGQAKGDFLLLCKWAKRRCRADFGHKLVAQLNSDRVAKPNLNNNVREVGAGSQCKSMWVCRDKQRSAGDGCCGAAWPLADIPARFTPFSSLQISFINFFLLISVLNEPGQPNPEGWRCCKASFCSIS